jgi:hypothetical protein
MMLQTFCSYLYKECEKREEKEKIEEKRGEKRRE